MSTFEVMAHALRGTDVPIEAYRNQREVDRIITVAILEAMIAEPPSAEMIAAGWKVLADRKKVAEVYRLGPGGGVREIFAAMLQQALEDAKKR